MRSSSRKVHISKLLCPDCKNMFPIPRIQTRQREKGHIKTIWCPFCKEEKDMLEIRDMDIYRNFMGELIAEK